MVADLGSDSVGDDCVHQFPAIVIALFNRGVWYTASAANLDLQAIEIRRIGASRSTGIATDSDILVGDQRLEQRCQPTVHSSRGTTLRPSSLRQGTRKVRVSVTFDTFFHQWKPWAEAGGLLQKRRPSNALAADSGAWSGLFT